MDEIQNFITELKLEGRMSDNTIRSYQTDLKKMFSYMEANGYADMTSVSEKALGE